MLKSQMDSLKENETFALVAFFRLPSTVCMRKAQWVKQCVSSDWLIGREGIFALVAFVSLLCEQSLSPLCNLLSAISVCLFFYEQCLSPLCEQSEWAVSKLARMNGFPGNIAVRSFCRGMLCWDFGEFSEYDEYAELFKCLPYCAQPKVKALHEVLKHQRVMMNRIATY